MSIRIESTDGWRTHSRPVDRRTDPHLRCGICDEPIERGERTEYVDDERCHADCARAERGESDD